MKYLLTGADRDTGEDIEMTVEAASEVEARGRAQRKGILVAACVFASTPPTPPPPNIPAGVLPPRGVEQPPVGAVAPSPMPAWLDRLTLPPLRTTQNGLLLLAVIVVGSFAIAAAVVLLLFGVGAMAIADAGTGFRLMALGLALLTVGVPNALHAQARAVALNASARGVVPSTSSKEAGPRPVERRPPRPSITLPRLSLPWPLIIHLAAPLILGARRDLARSEHVRVVDAPTAAAHHCCRHRRERRQHHQLADRRWAMALRHRAFSW